MISFVIPAFNESQSVALLLTEIQSVMQRLASRYEVIFVNDGSRDGTQSQLKALHRRYPTVVRVLEFTRNFGKAAALSAGFAHARGDLIATLDADLQDVPAGLPELLAKLATGYDVVCGWKQRRQDNWLKNTTSRLYNAATNLISRTKLHDHNCGFKLLRAETVRDLPLYGELHRYLPVLLSARGYRVGEVKVRHRARRYGQSKYGGIRFIHGFLDLFTVFFLTRFRSRPLHLFGLLGVVSLLLGLLLALYLTYLKFVTGSAIGDRPLLLLSVMLMIMGVQLGVMGLVGEQITTALYRHQSDYSLRSELG